MHAQPLSAAERTYLIDRYDQNVRAVDDALGRLIDALDPADTLIVTSDNADPPTIRSDAPAAVGLGWALPPSPHVRLGPAAPTTLDRLEALGYVQPPTPPPR